MCQQYSSVKSAPAGIEFLELVNIILMHESGSLGSRPSPYVRVLIARGGQIEARGRPGMIRHVRRRSVVGQYLARAPWCRRGTLFP